MNCTENDMMETFRRALNLPEEVPTYLSFITTGGSHRTYRRIHYGGKSAILMQYDEMREENNYYAAIADFLQKIGVAVPRIICHDSTKRFIIMEDLGEKDLWSFRNAPWDLRREYYRKTLSVAAKLHAFPLEGFPRDKVPLMDGFGPSLYRWERDYFQENFVRSVCCIIPNHSDSEALEKELNALADHLERTAKTLVHRDFQSQNVMICNGEPVLIDFQGLRFGSPFYDLGSLLYDPYVEFTDEGRRELLAYYYQLSKMGCEWKVFKELFIFSSAQRLMQALGAYGFLGLKQGQTTFLRYIPNGLKNLLDITGLTTCLPLLRDLCLRCRTSLHRK